MQSEDSFNESEEIYNIYSSKNFKDTFKAQFQKLIANKPCSQSITSTTGANSLEDVEPQIKKFSEENTLLGIENEVINNRTVSPDVVTLDSPVEDNLQKRITRRSIRLRNKRNPSNSCNVLLNNSIDDSPIVIKKVRGRKKAMKGIRRKKKVDEVVILDSPEPSNSLDEDDLNPEVSVKVIWKSVHIKKFSIRKFQKMSKIYEELSKEENIPLDKIMLTFNNIKVNQSDTPDSLNLQVYHFLDGGVLNEATSSIASQCRTSLDKNLVIIKFQGFNKKVIKVPLDRNEKLKVGMIKCSEQLEVPFNKIKFYFDGELLDSSETPSSLGLENDEIIDIKIFD